MQDPATGQQQEPWDLFKIVLSKPLGTQKLGMVLKHAQVTRSRYTSKESKCVLLTPALHRKWLLLCCYSHVLILLG